MKLKNLNMKFAVAITLVVAVILIAVVVFSNKQQSMSTEIKQVDVSGQPVLQRN